MEKENLVDMLGISEIFFSLQGESTFSGIPTVFVRFYGCNLGCKWCDSDYARNGEESNNMSIDEIIEAIQKESTYFERDNVFICITGGEPLHQPAGLRLLCEAILRRWGANAVITIETNGSYVIPWHLPNTFWVVDIKPPSSGHKQEPHEIRQLVRSLEDQDEIKFVIANEEDFLFAKVVINNLIPMKFLERRTVILSPAMGTENIESIKKLAEWILEYRLPVRMQIQMHKVIWPDVQRGV